jgi:hypothetical protein
VAARFVPQLEAALAAGEWDRALEITAIMQGLDPGDEAVRRWSFQAHMQVGQALVGSGQADQALGHFVEARALAAEDPVAQRWEASTRAYLSGLEALQAGQWDAAIQSFTQVREQMSGYADAYPRLIEAYRRKAQAASEARDWSPAIETLIKARELAPGDQGLADSLALAYRERGIAREQEDKLKEARADLEAALVLWPHDAKAKEHLDQVMLQLFPPKRIEINISKQRMLVYEGDTVIHEWRISTGLPGRDTAAGHFKVLDKIPMAYSSIWRLKMPYWLGIYYVGPIENGIHALPIRPDGTVMWGGLLGTKQSYGCIILDNKAAKTLYDWAEIGTRVDIHY